MTEHIITFENGLQSNCIHLTQWDRDVTLKISGVEASSFSEVHMGNSSMQEFLSISPNQLTPDILVQVPNILLQQPLDIIGYIYIDKLTQYRFDIGVQTRAQPQDVPTDPEVPYYPLGEEHYDPNSPKAMAGTAMHEALQSFVSDFQLAVNADGILFINGGITNG